MTKIPRLAREGTKERQKLEAMCRLGPPHGADHRDLEDIQDSSWGTFKNDAERYAKMLGGELRIWGSGPSRRYWIKMPATTRISSG